MPLLTRLLAPLALLLVVGVILLPRPAGAFRLVPIEMEFEPAGRGATQIFQLQNDNADPVAVEITIKARAMDRDGQDVLTDAGDDWVIFPEQIILQPGESQSVRVQWIGPATPDRELAFRLIAEQLPIDIGRPPARGGQVRLLVNYIASLYVMPAGVRADVGVVSAQEIATPDGRRLELVLRNGGTTRKPLNEPTLTLKAGGTTVTLTPDRLGGLNGENMLAGATRRFLLPWPEKLPVGAVTASLSLP
ncbi:molecular chaperone [Rhodospirillum centenum]|uniref:Pili assembly chaperone N-terminal domain-containing protein n=1 Tax=Rhodospirillum centenum (strain ATCC 51521 / SW) TaxID=414684 RepID=B6IQ70_RHOCS|nr:fimbria/pilus periplasmic chaperone [Rhodospirillum centenum]ACI97606.1 conserved hypothetical protein [Rhodospirillum centenum SW]